MAVTFDASLLNKNLNFFHEMVCEASSYLLYKPDFSNWAITDPSISPKNLPTCVKRNTEIKYIINIHRDYNTEWGITYDPFRGL